MQDLNLLVILPAFYSGLNFGDSERRFLSDGIEAEPPLVFLTVLKEPLPQLFGCHLFGLLLVGGEQKGGS